MNGRGRVGQNARRISCGHFFRVSVGDLVGPALNAADLLVPEPGQTKPPRLIAKSWKGDLRSFLEGTIAYGRVGTVMPAWGQEAGGPFRTDQIHDLATFIMNWANDPGKKWGGASERVAIGGVAPAPAVAPLPEAPPNDVRSAALGRYLFEGPLGCGECHVFNGTTGQTGPELTGVVERMGRDYVYQSIINPDAFASQGHAAGAMPDTFDFVLTDIQVQSIIDYLESPEAAGPATGGGQQIARQSEPMGPENGQKVANQAGCLACHSVDGTTLVGPSWKGLFGRAETFEDGSSLTVDADYIHESIVNPGARVVKGFANIMPGNYGDTLTDAEISDIISYIETLK